MYKFWSAQKGITQWYISRYKYFRWSADMYILVRLHNQLKDVHASKKVTLAFDAQFLHTNLYIAYGSRLVNML